MIISVSRRCDIPRFQFEWLMEKLDAGFVDVPNPFNAARIKRVSLLPFPKRPPGTDAPSRHDGVSALVLWTRNPENIATGTEELENRSYRFYTMVTLTGYPVILEPGAPEKEAVLSAMRRLSGKIGPDRLIWRYDPVFLSSITNHEFHRTNFRELAGKLRGTVHRVIISLYDEYRGAKRRIEALEKAEKLKMIPASEDAELLPETRELLADLASIALGEGMEMQSCGEAVDLSALGIKAGACIDGDLLRKLWGLENLRRDKNQRPFCRCVSSIDIGRYGNCPAGCVYCYARI